MLISNECDKLFAAIVAAQAEMVTLAETGQNTFYKRADGKSSTYVPLEKLREATRPVLAKHKLALICLPGEFRDGCQNMTFIIAHESGQSMSHDTSIPVSKQDAQGAGGAITYLRRYFESAVFGVASDRDDDGNTASGKNGNGDAPPTVKQRLNGKHPTDATADQVEQIRKLIPDAGSDVADIIGYYKVESLDKLTSKQADQVIDRLKQKVANKKAAA